MYYNTTRLKGLEWEEAIKKAKVQNEYVLLYFKRFGYLAPSEVYDRCRNDGKMWPLTSIRRSINTLTNKDCLVKTGKKIIGPYGMPEYIWKIKEDE